jgi:hypothetical protein
MRNKPNNMPGFTAERSLYRVSGCYQLMREGPGYMNSQEIVPQFSMRAFVCAALAAAILAGQEELAPVAANYCSILA